MRAGRIIHYISVSYTYILNWPQSLYTISL